MMLSIARACRRITLLLLVSLLLSMAVPAFAAGAGDFSDVSGSSWYYDAVDFVCRKGLFQGISSGVFFPDGTITRAMFITVLGRYAGADASSWCVGSVSGSGVNMRSGPGTSYSVVTTLDKGAALTIKGKSGDWYQVSAGSDSGYIRGDYVSVRYHTFSDVSFGSYYAGYAIWAYEKGIVDGNGSSAIFSPDSNITREQVCTMLNRFASVMGVSMSSSGSSASFTDDGSISSWAKDSVYALNRAGIVEGRNTGDFDPAGYATRAEAAAIIQRFDKAVGGFKAPAGQSGNIAPEPDDSGNGSGGENATPPAAPTVTPGDPPPAEQPESGTPLGNAGLVNRLSQGSRGCCLATSFSMAANLILGRNEYGPFDWTASDTDDSLSYGSNTSFKGSDGHTYRPAWGSGDLSALKTAIDNALSGGCPIIASVQGSSTASTHYVLVVGWTDGGHSDYLIVDPAGGGDASIQDSAVAMAGERGYSLGNRDGTFVYISFS